MKNAIKVLPISILAGACIYSAMELFINEFDFTYRHYIAFILVSITLILYMVKVRFGQYATAITLLLGNFNITSFTYNTYTISFRVLSYKVIEFQPVSTCVFILFIIINYKSVKAKLEFAFEWAWLGKH